MKFRVQAAFRPVLSAWCVLQLLSVGAASFVARAEDAPAPVASPASVAAPVPVATPAAPVAEGPRSDSLYDTSLEDLMNIRVSTVSRREETVADAPSNITVITAAQIKEWGSRSLTDVLRRVAGFDIVFDRDEWVMDSRGIVSDNNRQYMILIDGHRLYQQHATGPALLMDLPNDLDRVKQIEIVRGPGSVLWGSGSMAGIVNLVTFNGIDLVHKSQTNLVYGADNTERANFMLGDRLGDRGDYLFSGTFVRSDGRTFSVDDSTKRPIVYESTVPGATNPPYGRFLGRMNAYDSSYTFQFKAHLDHYYINSYLFSTRFRNMAIEDESLAGRLSIHNKELMMVEAGWEKTVLTDLAVKFRVSGELARNGYIQEQGASDFFYYNDRFLNFNLDLDKPFFDDKLHVALGGEFINNKLGPSFNTPGGAGSPANFFDQSQFPPSTGVPMSWFVTSNDNNASLYAMATYRLIPTLTLTAATRLDHNAKFGANPNEINPRAGAVWKINNANTLKLLYGQSFLRIDISSLFVPSPLLTGPERIKQWELVHQLNLGRINLTSTAYWQMLDGAVYLLSDKTFANTGKWETFGLEEEFSASLLSYLKVWSAGDISRGRAFGYSSALPVDSIRTLPNGDLLNYPNWTLRTGVTGMLSHLSVSPALRLRGPVKIRTLPASAVSPTAGIDMASYDVLPTQPVLDLNIRWDDPNSWWAASVYFDNLLNNRSPEGISIRNGTVEPYGRYIEAKATFRL